MIPYNEIYVFKIGIPLAAIPSEAKIRTPYADFVEIWYSSSGYYGMDVIGLYKNTEDENRTQIASSIEDVIVWYIPTE